MAKIEVNNGGSFVNNGGTVSVEDTHIDTRGAGSKNIGTTINGGGNKSDANGDQTNSQSIISIHADTINIGLLIFGVFAPVAIYLSYNL